MKNYFNFTDRKYIVTGASSGIGKSTAICLSEQGAQVVLMGRDETKLRETREMMSGDYHQIIPIDLGKEKDLTEVFNKIISDGKKLDGLVHAAGIATILPLNMIKRHNLEESMNINLYALIELARLFSKKKYHKEKGTIVAVSSIAVKYPSKCQTIYTATKGAVNAVVETLAIELASKNIRINSVMPGATDTKMLREAMDVVPEELKNQKMERQLLGISAPEDIVGSIMFLLSDASAAATGRAFYADGGILG